MKNKNHNFILKGQWSPKLTLILGLEAKSPKIFPSLSIFGPSPRIKEELTLDCHLIFIHWISMHGTHTSKHLSHQGSLLFFSLPHSRPKHTHTYTNISQALSTTLKNTSSLSTQRSRNLGSFQEDISTNSSSKVRLCLDLWLRFFLSSKSFPNPCQNRDLTS